jgi:predicted AlkP superfamily phosphohydrolase/phosphomutase
VIRQPGLLVIALDAVDPDIIQSGADDGTLPTWRALLDDGASFRTRNPPGLYVGAIWPSLFTAVSPTRHKRYCYEQLRAGTYEVRPFRNTDYAAEAFWTALGRAGRTVAVVDVPKSPPPDPTVALHVVDWRVHDPDPALFQSHPADLRAEIERDYGSKPVDICDAFAPDLAGARALRDHLIQRVESKTQLCLDLLSRRPWDLFCVGFSEGHCAGHQFWRIHDPGHPAHDPAVREALGDPLQQVYRALDRAVARLMEAAGRHTPTFVLASHGMGPHYDASFMLPDLLLAMQGVRPQPLGVRSLERGWTMLPESLLAAMRPAVVALRRRLSGRRAMGERPLGEVLQVPPASRLRYFAVPNNDAHGAIRLNLVGREPHGLVEPGREALRMVEEIRSGLASFVNEETGEPIVEAVRPIAELFPGEPTDELPDLIVDWNRRAPIRKVRSHRYGTIARQFPGVRSGDHKPDGLLVARGPGISPARHREPVPSVDVPATVAQRLGVTLREVDGHPIAALIAAPTGALRAPP